VSVALYMDVHIQLAVANGVRARGVDVLRSQEDGTTTLDDPDLLDRATSLGRILVTQDQDFLTEAARRQMSGIPFAGIVFAAQGSMTVGQMIRDLEMIGLAGEPIDFADRVYYLPLP
jgi:predicted nuclease of predicted toxin-antitoxin system